MAITHTRELKFDLEDDEALWDALGEAVERVAKNFFDAGYKVRRSAFYVMLASGAKIDQHHFDEARGEAAEEASPVSYATVTLSAYPNVEERSYDALLRAEISCNVYRDLRGMKIQLEGKLKPFVVGIEADLKEHLDRVTAPRPVPPVPQLEAPEAEEVQAGWWAKSWRDNTAVMVTGSVVAIVGVAAGVVLPRILG